MNFYKLLQGNRQHVHNEAYLEDFVFHKHKVVFTICAWPRAIDTLPFLCSHVQGEEFGSRGATRVGIHMLRRVQHIVSFNSEMVLLKYTCPLIGFPDQMYMAVFLVIPFH